MKHSHRIVVALLLLAFAILVYGCGGGTNVPAVQLTASTVASQADSSSHVHTVSIPFGDVSASPGADVYQYRTQVTNGHSHVIALTKQQMIDLNNGMRVTVTSSAPDTGTNHTHAWSIQGGGLLYDKNCYNCHSNDKRGNGPMNVSFNASQTSAVVHPDSAPLSTSPAALPDPNFTPAAN